jgi:hypothetical protein
MGATVSFSEESTAGLRLVQDGPVSSVYFHTCIWGELQRRRSQSRRRDCCPLPLSELSTRVEDEPLLALSKVPDSQTDSQANDGQRNDNGNRRYCAAAQAGI